MTYKKEIMTCLVIKVLDAMVNLLDDSGITLSCLG